MNYRELVEFTMNRTLSRDDQLVNAALGLAGEAGEFADWIKKARFQGARIDRDKLLKELGDLRWYVELACWCLETTVAEVEDINTKKLLARYPEGFSAERSNNRKE